jgi:molybdenum cofactor cytidylyltransferase
VGAVSPSETGALILLADQPQVPVELLVRLKAKHAASEADIVAPRVHGRRANPVLWHRRTFDDLSTLRGDVGGRVLFSKYDVAWVPWDDEWLCFDVDTPSDYQKLIQKHR